MEGKAIKKKNETRKEAGQCALAKLIHYSPVA